MSPSRRIVAIDWIDAHADDIRPRAAAGQLPVLARLLAAGRIRIVPAGEHGAWSLAELIAGSDIEPPATASSLGAHESIQPDEIDSRIVAFFPASPTIAPPREALARLYSLHNHCITRLSAATDGTAPLVVRHEFLREIGEHYATSIALPEARTAALRLLDLLLGDLLRAADGRHSIFFRCLGPAHRDGLLVWRDPRPEGMPPHSVVSPESFRVILAAAMGRGGKSFAASVGWDSPLVPPATRLRPSPPAKLTPGVFHLRRATADDAWRVSARFPRTSWPADGDGRVLFADQTEAFLLGACSIHGDGSLKFTLDDAAGEAGPRMIEAALVDARKRAIPALSTVEPIKPNSVEHRALEACGFEIFDTVTLWALPVEGMLRRARRMPAKLLRGWETRPCTRADITHWLTRPETAGLLTTDTGFEADLSWAASYEGRPAGLVLIQRMDRAACINLLVLAEEFRIGGGIVPLMARGPAALAQAGFAEVVFTTNRNRLEAATYARRCEGRTLDRHLRLTCVL